jgi:hypothetical protein
MRLLPELGAISYVSYFYDFRSVERTSQGMHADWCSQRNSRSRPLA